MAKKTQGRPSKYSQKVADEICTRLVTGRTLRDVCRDDDMPHEATVRTWAHEDRNGFFTQYTKSREIGYMCMADELVEIADDGTNDWMDRRNEDGTTGDTVLNGEHVQRSRMRIDTRKWLLSKALPKIYGDKMQLDQKHDVSDPMKELLGYVAENGKRVGDDK